MTTFTVPVYKILPKFECPQCGDLHELLVFAESCCPVYVNKVYVCPTCKEHYPTETLALECFNDCNPQNMIKSAFRDPLTIDMFSATA